MAKRPEYSVPARIVLANRELLRAYAGAMDVWRKLDFDGLARFQCDDASPFRAALSRMPSALLAIDDLCGGGSFGEEGLAACQAVAAALPEGADYSSPDLASPWWACRGMAYLACAVEQRENWERAKHNVGWARCGALDSVADGPRPELLEEFHAMTDADFSRAPAHALVERTGWLWKRRTLPARAVRSQDFGPLWS